MALDLTEGTGASCRGQCEYLEVGERLSWEKRLTSAAGLASGSQKRLWGSVCQRLAIGSYWFLWLQWPQPPCVRE